MIVSLLLGRRAVAATLAMTVAGIGGCALLAGNQASGARRVGANDPDLSLATLPPAARSAISGTLGRLMPGYEVRRLRAGNPAQGLSAGWSSRGLELSGGTGRVGLRLMAFGRFNRWRALGPLAPTVVENRVSYSAPGIQEWFLNGPSGIEQGFTVSRRPAGDSPLLIQDTLVGGVRARADGHGRALVTAPGVSLRFDSLTALDATGRALPAQLQAGRRKIVLRIDDRGARYPLRIDPLLHRAAGLSVDADLSNDNRSYDDLGYAVAGSGNTIVVGAPHHTLDGVFQQGAVFVFVRPATGWSGNVGQAAELTETAGRTGDNLGASIAVAGRTVIAGAPGRSVGGRPSRGAAFVFTRPSQGWSGIIHPSALLTGTGGNAHDYFGTSVAAANGLVIVGAPGRSVGGRPAAGAAYVFQAPSAGSGWTGSRVQSATLVLRDSRTGDGLGHAVAIAGSAVVVGAAARQVAGRDGAGAVFVFTRPRTKRGWAGMRHEAARLTATGGQVADYFGTSIAAVGDVVAVGSPYRRVDAHAGAGTVFMFVKPRRGWAGSLHQKAELRANPAVTGALVGFQLGLSGSTVVAGAPHLGAAFVFVGHGPRSWHGRMRPVTELIGSGLRPGDLFGDSVAIAGRLAVAGAPDHRPGGNHVLGATFAFAEPTGGWGG